MPDAKQESIENTIPVLAVADVWASIDFYKDALGFKFDWIGGGEPPQIASVSRDGHVIMLQRRIPMTPGCVWIGCSDVSLLWERIRSNPRIEVEQRPTNHAWALDIKVRDPDGNVLWFGSEALKDVPLGAEPT